MTSPHSLAAPEPIRVLQLIKGLGRGGAEVLLLEGLRHADRQNFDYRFAYFLPHKNALEPSLRTEGAPVTCFESSTELGVLRSIPRLTRFLREERIDLVHAHLAVAAIAGRLAARWANVPFVYTEHGPLEYLHPVTRWLNLLTWRLQDAVVAVSPQVVDSIRTHTRAPVPVHLVINGVATDRFDPTGFDPAAEKAQHNIPREAPVVGTVAVFRPQKRLDDWLRVAHRVKSKHPETRFLMVGDGPLRSEMEQLAQQLGLTEAVHFVGLQDDVRPFLSMMDVYLLSSGFEGLPVALLEAMAMARPPVATAVGGVPEIVEDGVNGRLTTVGAVEEMARAVDELLEEPLLRRSLGARARQTIEQRFAMTRMTRQLEDLYLHVLGAPRRA